MAVNKDNIRTNLQAVVDSMTINCNAEDFLAVTYAAKCLEPDRDFVVNYGCDLPDHSTTPIAAGTIVYVDELNMPVISNGGEWLGPDGRTYRTDVAQNTLWGWGVNSYCRTGLLCGINYSSPAQEYLPHNDWTHVAAGKCVTLAIRNGSLYGVGQGWRGEIGNNLCCYIQFFCQTSAQEITKATNWCFVDTSTHDGTHQSVAAIKTNGQVWTWGSNYEGSLGINRNDGSCYSSPVQEITSATNWSFTSVANGTIRALKTNNTLWSWGRGCFGTLATNSIICYSSPVQEITSAADWCAVSSGSYTVSAVKTTGTLWGWGYGFFGALGTNNTICYSSPVQEVTSATDWCTVSVGYHRLSVKTNGTLWVSGWNQCGALGTNDTICYSSPVQEVTSATDWQEVCAGNRCYSAALKTSGQIWLWGGDICGRLAQNNSIDYSSPVQEITSATNWTCVDASSCHVIALKQYV